MSQHDLSQFSLGELVRLRDRVAQALSDHYEQDLALVFTDVVRSTEYVEHFGDSAGRAQLERHRELLARAMSGRDARLVDTAGDGAFVVAPSVAEAAEILIRLQRELLASNAELEAPHHLRVRSAMHFGRVLVDDTFVTGEAVHTAARLMGSGCGGEIRISEAAFQHLPGTLRTLCQRLGPQRFKGVGQPVDVLLLDWRDPGRFATRVELVESGHVVPLGYQMRVSLGRLDQHDGRPANDIVLSHPVDKCAVRLSRWHAQLEMTTTGYQLRAVGRATTEIGGRVLKEGEAARVVPGESATLGGVLTLQFHGPAHDATRTEFS